MWQLIGRLQPSHPPGVLLASAQVRLQLRD
jgi:hypothetical protein